MSSCMGRVFVFMFFLSLVLLAPYPSEACEYCGGSSGLGKVGGTGYLINSPSAATLGKGKADVGFVFTHTRFDTINAEKAHALHEEGRDVHDKGHEEIYNMVVGYGVLDDLDFHLTVPIVSRKSVEIHGKERTEEVDGKEVTVEDLTHLGELQRATGFGDMSLTGRWRFWKQGVDVSLIGGVKAPTGKTSDVDVIGNKFETELQPGSGSWDGLFGLAFTGFWLDKITAGGSFLYKLRGEGAQDFKFGDEFDLNIGTALPLRPGSYPNPSAVVEFNQSWALKDQNAEPGKIFDSGGYSFFVTPGITVDISKNVTFFWGMPIAAYQKLGGAHQETRFSLLAGTSIGF